MVAAAVAVAAAITTSRSITIPIVRPIATSASTAADPTSGSGATPRMIQTMGGFGQRNNQGWGDGGEEGQSAPQQQGQSGQPQQANPNGHAEGERPGGREERREQNGDAEPGLGGVAFLQGGRSAPTDTDNDPAADEQPEIPEFTPGTGRRG